MATLKQNALLLCQHRGSLFQTEHLLTHMREICINNRNKIDFDNIDNRDCKNRTGLLLDQLEDTCSFILINIKSTPSRTPKTSGLFKDSPYSIS